MMYRTLDGGVNRWFILAAVSLISECRGRCLPGGASCSAAKYLVSWTSYSELGHSFDANILLNLLVCPWKRRL